MSLLVRRPIRSTAAPPPPPPPGRDKSLRKLLQVQRFQACFLSGRFLLAGERFLSGLIQGVFSGLRLRARADVVSFFPFLSLKKFSFANTNESFYLAIHLGGRSIGSYKTEILRMTSTGDCGRRWEQGPASRLRGPAPRCCQGPPGNSRWVSLSAAVKKRI